MSFEPEFIDDIDDDEEDIELEAFIEYLRQLKEQEEKDGVIRIPNLKRMREMEDSVKLLEKISKQYNMKVKVEYGIEKLGYAGYVRLICPFGFSTTDVPELCDALAAASNTEFVIENGYTQIGIVYDGVMHTERIKK